MKIYCDACCGRGFKVDTSGWESECLDCEAKGYTGTSIHDAMVKIGHLQTALTFALSAKDDMETVIYDLEKMIEANKRGEQ